MIVHFKGISGYQFPQKCANSCDLGNGRFMIFGGFPEENLNWSCIYNANNDSLEKIIDMSAKYYTYSSKSPSLFVDGEIAAIDENRLAHVYVALTNNWNHFDANNMEIVDFS